MTRAAPPPQGKPTEPSKPATGTATVTVACKIPGGWLLQKHIRQMLAQGCKYAIVECTSEGLAQNRHLGINFGAALITNLSEAHVEAHGGFGNYLKAKQKLFKALKINPSASAAGNVRWVSA